MPDIQTTVNNLSGNLTSMEPAMWSHSFMIIFMVGAILFCGSMIVMAFLFGWANKITIQDIKNAVLLLVFSLSVPLIGGQLLYRTNNYSQASLAIIIKNINVMKVNDTQATVDFETSEPALIYLEYRDFSRLITEPVLPKNGTESKTEHSFIINDITAKGGEAYIIIAGKKYGVKGKPININ